MASNAKARGWGSLFSGAVAGLESRLDVILADDPDASARARLAEKEKEKKSLEERARAASEAAQVSGGSRERSRLEARLARAVGRPVEASLVVAEGDGRDAMQERVEIAPEQVGSESEESKNGILSTKKADRAEPVMDTDVESGQDELETGESTAKDNSGAETAADTQIHEERAPSGITESSRPRTVSDVAGTESQDHLERIDALHSKVLFLSSQLYSNAAAAAQQLANGSADQKLAEQETKIAQLMQEGEKMSHDQLKYSQAIKVLRSRVLEQERISADLRKRVEKSELQTKELQDQLKASQAREKLSSERAAKLSKAEKDLQSTSTERDDAMQRIKTLMKDLREADNKASDAVKNSQSGKLNEQLRLVADLKDELSNVRIEKKLVEDRAKLDVKERIALHDREIEKARLTETELRIEVRNLEAKLEMLRSMSEEVSSSTTSDAQAKLLRQIETLQTQYSNASDNWQTLESSLTNRVTALESERDELAKREADGRKKAREMTSKARRLEEDLDASNEKLTALESEVTGQQSTASKLEAKLKSAELDLQRGKEALERSQKEFDSCLETRLEAERKRLQAELTSPTFPPDTRSEMHSPYTRNDSFPSISQRKASATDLASTRRSRMPSSDFSALIPSHTPESTPRLGIARRLGSSRAVHNLSGTNTSGKLGLASPALTMNGGTTPVLGFPPETPSLHQHDEDDDDLPSRDSPQRTIAELMSVSTAGAGPSVQLVERMSATVRRLEMEKAASRETLSRLKVERDEAREEIVSMMREADELKGDHEKVLGLETQLGELQRKFDAVLEMLGEKTERCEDLENDVQSWKSLYHQHLDRTTK